MHYDSEFVFFSFKLMSKVYTWAHNFRCTPCNILPNKFTKQINSRMVYCFHNKNRMRLRWMTVALFFRYSFYLKCLSTVSHVLIFPFSHFCLWALMVCVALEHYQPKISHINFILFLPESPTFSPFNRTRNSPFYSGVNPKWMKLMKKKKSF